MAFSKPPEERRLEIIEAAQQLFITQGFNNTTIVQILRKVGIAKGTLYYYFQSKEEILDAIVLMYIEQGVEAARALLADRSMGAHEKLRLIISAQSFEQGDKGEVIEQLHGVNNAELHMKSITETIKAIAPIIAEVIQQGIEEGVYRTDSDNVQEVVEFLLVGSQFLLDIGIFEWNAQQLLKRAEAFQSIVESVLHAERGSFSYISEMYQRFVTHFEVE